MACTQLLEIGALGSFLGLRALDVGRESEEGAEGADFEQLRQAMEAGGAMSQVSNEELAQMLLDAAR